MLSSQRSPQRSSERVKTVTNTETIAAAIRNLAVIEFGYDGYRRVYWPYILGETKKGEIEVFGWQQLSGKGSQPDFRQFRLDGLTGLVVTGSHFARPLQPVNLAQRGFVRVFVRI
jgi:predicted DNA-binding transcriptional regulator YafY